MSPTSLDIGLLTASLGLPGGLLIALLTHRFNLRRERNQKRRELVLTYKLEALRDLQEGCREDRDIVHKAPCLERAVFSIQIIGTRKQIILATRFAADYAGGQLAQATELINDL